MKNKNYYLLGAINFLMGIAAFTGGFILMVIPDGSFLGLNEEMLINSPFHNYFIPGLFLFVIIGLLNLISSVYSFLKHRYTARLSFLQGSILVAWILLQIHFIGLISILQPFIFVIGTIEVYISISMVKFKKNDTLNLSIKNNQIYN